MSSKKALRFYCDAVQHLAAIDITMDSIKSVANMDGPCGGCDVSKIGKKILFEQKAKQK